MHDLIAQWMHRNARTSLCVISPHLDDAVYSAFAALTQAGIAQREVVTVVTKALPGLRTHWSSLSGFDSSEAEHLGRSREDREVLGRLGINVVHLGAVTEDSHSLRLRLEEFASGKNRGVDKCAFLLPAGAGRQSGIARRIWRRVRRDFDPLGSHPEHVQVRNIMTRALRRQRGALWGYYAEMPYILNDSVATLHRRLERRADCRLQYSECRPDPEEKLAAAAGYVSQANLLLGREPDLRLQFCSHPERLFLQ